MLDRSNPVFYLQQLTGAGARDAKAALVLSDQDINRAVQLLRNQGTSRAPTPLELQAQIYLLTKRIEALERK